MFDCDDPGTAGAKEALWFFAERQVDARLVWSPTMHDGEFHAKQPENIAKSEWEKMLGPSPSS